MFCFAKHRLHFLMYIYYFFAAISIWFGIQSLRGGFRFASYVRSETANPSSGYVPFISVIAPSRGLEAGLKENLQALLSQNYPSYEVVYVLDREDDPVNEMILELQPAQAGVSTRIVIAGPATDSGQKVHNLIAAVKTLSGKTEVIVFVDTDARPGVDWLRSLVAPLIDTNLGAVSGYRWFIPIKGNFASRLRSVWNASIASALGRNQNKNFCWGGSTAIRRATFDSLDVAQRWRGSVSDDFTMTRVLQEANLPIRFCPDALIPSLGDCNFHELLEFTTRQLKITRVYAPHLWKPLLIGSLLFNLTFWGGILFLFWRLSRGDSWVWLAITLSLLLTLGSFKALVRWRAICIPLSHYRQLLNKDLLAHLFFWPLASSLYLYNAILAGFSRRISWRGITYELKSTNEAVIISRSGS